MHAELLKAASPLLLQTLQTLLQRAADAPWVSVALRLARSLVRAAARAQNNLLVDSIVQLLVDRTRLPIRPARFRAALLPAENARPVGDLCFVRAESAETRAPAGKCALWLEYSPLRNVREFGRGAGEEAQGGACVGVECYKTLLAIVRENGGSIQKGYSDVVG